MTRRNLSLITAVLLVATGCAPAGEVTAASPPPLPTAVNCADASTLKAQAAESRRHIAEQPSDRAKIISGNRAKFLTSLVVAAELKCKVSTGDVEALLQRALEVGRAAETTRSEYEAARAWTEADLVVADAIALLLGQLQAQPAR